MNLRSGQRGIFPEAHIIEIDLVDEICSSVLPEKNRKFLYIYTYLTYCIGQINADRDTFYLTMLASVEVAHHKGNDILTQAINKVFSTILLHVSFLPYFRFALYTKKRMRYLYHKRCVS